MLLLIHNASKWVERKIFMGERIYLFYFIEFSVLFDQRLFHIFSRDLLCYAFAQFFLTVYLCIFHSIICENASQSLYSCQDFSIENSLYIFLFKFPTVSTSPSSSSLLILCTYLCYGLAFTIHCSHGAELIYLVRKFVDDNQKIYSRRFISIVWKGEKSI